MSKRKSRLCRGCRKAKTTSVTALCVACRPPDAVPAIHRDGPVISFAGITLTEAQALTLANNLVDAIENREQEHQWMNSETNS